MNQLWKGLDQQDRDTICLKAARKIKNSVTLRSSGNSDENHFPSRVHMPLIF